MVKKILIQLLILLLVSNHLVYAAQIDGSIGTVILKMIFYLGAIILVLFVAIYGTRFIAKNSKRFIASKYMKVVDVLNLGTNFKILMIEIDENIYVIVLTNNSVKMIDKLPKEVITQKNDFQGHLDKHALRIKDKHFNNIYKNIFKLLNPLDNMNDKEEVDDEEDR